VKIGEANVTIKPLPLFGEANGREKIDKTHTEGLIINYLIVSLARLACQEPLARRSQFSIIN